MLDKGLKSDCIRQTLLINISVASDAEMLPHESNRPPSDQKLLFRGQIEQSKTSRWQKQIQRADERQQTSQLSDWQQIRTRPCFFLSATVDCHKCLWLWTRRTKWTWPPVFSLQLLETQLCCTLWLTVRCWATLGRLVPHVHLPPPSYDRSLLWLRNELANSISTKTSIWAQTHDTSGQMCKPSSDDKTWQFALQIGSRAFMKPLVVFCPEEEKQRCN